MEFSQEVLLSKWHLIALGLTLIACAGLIIGGYKKEIVIKTTLKAAIGFYIVTTIPLIWIDHEAHFYEREMAKALDEKHEEQQDDFILYTQYFQEDDGYLVKVYVGNYSQDEDFDGTVLYQILDEEKDVLKEDTYEDLMLKAGEKKEITSFHTDTKPDKYQYHYNE